MKFCRLAQPSRDLSTLNHSTLLSLGFPIVSRASTQWGLFALGAEHKAKRIALRGKILLGFLKALR